MSGFSGGGAPRRAVAGAAALLIAVSLVGCGGGGTSQSSYKGRSYTFAGSGWTFDMAVDTVGRFTVVARGAAGLPDGAGAQGAFGPDGRFYAQTLDGVIQFEGQANSTTPSVSCTVKRGAATLTTLVAAPVPAGAATPGALTGSFSLASGGAALLTADPSGHAVLWVDAGGVKGLAAVTVGADGTIVSADNTTVGGLTATGSNVELALTKLNGVTVSLDMTLTRVTRAKWTFLVFLNAANDLQEFGVLNVNQMEKVGSTADVNIVVQWKQADCADCGSPAWVSTRRYYVTRDTNTGTISSQLVEDLGPGVDMGDWRELSSFVRWAQQRYPADRYALVVWNHGAGWRNTRAAGEVALRSVSIDDDTGNEIQTWQLPQALNTSPRMDLLIFDASLMQMTEVAYEVREMAAYMVGSEESPPGEGYYYDSFLADLATSPTMTPRELATQIVNRTIEKYGSYGNITQSAVDLSRVQTLAERLNGFGNMLMLHSASNQSAVVSARRNAESYLYRDNKDLWHYAELVRANATTTALRASAADVQQALKAAVVAEAHGALHPNSNGLSIYVPDPASYLIAYSNLALTRVTDWEMWLQNQPPG
jgi:hypothetical protein